MKKNFYPTKQDPKIRLIEPMGYCFASDRITCDGEKVGYMYREEPDRDGDSGWRFLAGDEDDEYMDDPNNLDIYDVNTIVHYDSDILEYLHAPINSAFGRNENGLFEEEFFDPPQN